jgi:hypothetical protein
MDAALQRRRIISMMTFPFHPWLYRSADHASSSLKTLKLLFSSAASLKFATLSLAADESRLLDTGPHHRVWEMVRQELDAEGGA